MSSHSASTEPISKSSLLVTIKSSLTYSYFEKGCRKKCTRQSLKGFMGGFEFTVLQRNLKEWHESRSPFDGRLHERPLLNSKSRFDSYSVRNSVAEQGWRSGESTRPPPMWPGFKFRRRRHMWVEFVVGSLPSSERFFSGYSGFPLFSKTNISKFQFDQE